MFNNEALDVVIGIVLVYLLYSMLITIMGEYVSTKLGLRARLLRVAIERMLNDGYYRQLKTPRQHRIQFWLVKRFMFEPDGFKSSFAGRFYEFPAIKFLSRIETENKKRFDLTKPSYFSAAYFADTLIDILKEKSSGKTNVQRIAYTLHYNTQHIQPQTLKIIRNHFTNAQEDLSKFKANLVQWFDETMDRCNGWYKRKLQFVLFYLGLVVAIAFNIDSIHIARILSRDKEARQQLVDMGVRLAKDTATYKDFTGRASDTLRGKAILDKGFDHVTKDIQAANLILGLGWHYAPPLVNTTVVWSKPDIAHLPLLKSYAKLSELQASLKKRLTERQVTLQHQLGQAAIYRLDVLVFKNQLQQATPAKLLEAYSQKVADTVKLTGQILTGRAALRADSLNWRENARQMLAMSQPLLKAPLIRLSDVKFKKAATYELIGQRKSDFWEVLGYLLRGFFSHLPGLLITALALSLGAPFWFDLLNKLVSIRAAGVKPEEKKIVPTTEQPGVNPLPIPAPVPATDTDEAGAALDALTGQLVGEQGIIGLGLKLQPPGILVMVTSQQVITYLTNKYGNTWPLSPTATLPLTFAVEGLNFLHAGTCGGQISNAALMSNSGTLGAFLRKTGSNDDYFISCWHVLKDNYRYKDPAVNLDIVAFNNNVPGTSPIGTIVDGCLTDKLDVGIARCTAAAPKPANTQGTFSVKKQHRAVTAYDGLVSTPVQIQGMASQLVDATIFQYKLNITIPYDDGHDYMLYDVFSLIQTDDQGNISAPTTKGDSGALVLEAGTGVPLGMIFGGNQNYSYAIKFSNIFDTDQPYHGYYFNI
ncbi:hypothetical protein [Mucilaginibacter sp.]|uniref:hypothetical protein n=1 Tax=Mucilaginibacter sp. TaxID=1882438 RepID=UPI002627BE4E|nr:hypothetical protein [Mucilaginibacter sp.]